MQYVVMRHKKGDMDLFAEETDAETGKVKPISYEQYQKLVAQLGKRSKDAILPVQIAYFTGLRLGEVAGLTWQDINLEEQYLTVRRSVRYNGATHKHEIGSTKRQKADREKQRHIDHIKDCQKLYNHLKGYCDMKHCCRQGQVPSSSNVAEQFCADNKYSLSGHPVG